MSETNGENDTVRHVELEELTNAPSGAGILANGLELVRHLKVKLTASLGSAEISIGELMDLKAGSVFALDKDTNADLEIFLGERLVARGQLVVVDNNFGIQITEIAPR